MKIKRKYSPRKSRDERRVEAATLADTNKMAANVSESMPAEPFTPNDFAGAEAEKPKRKYTRRNASSDTAGFDFGKLMVFAGEIAAKVTTLITKQDAPLNNTETEMLDVLGKSCGRFLVDDNTIDELAPKYAKYAIFGGLALVAGVRAIDYFTRPRLTAGKVSSITYDTQAQDLDIPNMPDIQG